MSLFCCLLVESPASSGPTLASVARACSPRVEYHGEAVVFDVSGLERVLGPPAAIAAEVGRMAARCGRVRLAVAGTMTAAWVIAHAGGDLAAREGVVASNTTLVPIGEEAAALAPLPLEVLATLPDVESSDQAFASRRDRHQRSSRAASTPECLAVLRRWGLRTVGDLARLPEAEVRTRLGESGGRLHRAARGVDAMPLVPALEPAAFVERLDLEWPIEGPEPLSFVLARLCEALSAALERADRGAVTVTTRLRLVTRRTHERALQWPAPIRDARVLRTLILLDRESHPPSAAIDAVEIALGVTPARIVQGSLLSRALPSAEDLATLVARLSALMGETRVGAPALVDTHDERAMAMAPFSPSDRPGRSRRDTRECPAASRALVPECSRCLPPSLRRFQLPVAAKVVVDGGAPADVMPSAHGLPGGRIAARAGPWRSSGRWWAASFSRPSDEAWDRDEWEVELAGTGCVYRLARDRRTGGWQVLGILD